MICPLTRVPFVRLTDTFQPRRLILAPAAVGCNCLLANGQLEARAKVNGGRVLDVKDAARLVVNRFRRRVHH